MSVKISREHDDMKSETYIGSRTKKLNGDLFITGKARYLNDINLTDTVHMALLRSPYAHATIKSIDTSRVSDHPNVLLAVTGTELKSKMNPIPYYVDPTVFGGKSTDINCLAVDKVVYAGHPVVAVVATSKNDAEQALDLVAVEYEELPVTLSPENNAKDTNSKTESINGWEDNTVIRLPFVEGDVDRAFKETKNVLEDEISIQRVAHGPMETRGYIGSWDELDETLTFYGASQNPHPLRWVLSNALNIAENKIRVIAPHVGGGFGLKMHGHPEETLVCVLSRLLKKPVKWIEDRRESFLIGAREQKHRFKVAFNDDGKITALRNYLNANLGTLGAMPGWSMTFLTGLTIPSGYKIPNTDVQVTADVTNKGPWNASRGYGKEPAILVMERIVKLIGRELNMDPNEVRRRNLIQKDDFPYKTNTGLKTDGGDYIKALNKVEDLIGYHQLKEKQAKLRSEGKYLGIGFAFEITAESGDIPGTLVSGFDSSTVRLSPDGDVTVLTGVTTPGGGNETGIAQVVADELGVVIDDIVVIQGDTQMCPYGFGNYSGRGMLLGGGSAALAARDLRGRLAKIAAILLETDEDSLLFKDGIVTCSESKVSIPIKEVAYTIYTNAFGTAMDIEQPALESTKVYKPDNLSNIPDEKGRINPYPTFSYAAHVAVTEVDAETGIVNVIRYGVVHDCGTVINPTFVEGQMQGAVTMGIGSALSEEILHDENGVLLTNKFKTYLMPRASDIPNIEMGHQVTPSPYTLLGNKGAGEGGLGGAMAAVSNAVEDALIPFGVTVRKLPLSPPRVLQMIKEAEKTSEEVEDSDNRSI